MNEPEQPALESRIAAKLKRQHAKWLLQQTDFQTSWRNSIRQPLRSLRQRYIAFKNQPWLFRPLSVVVIACLGTVIFLGGMILVQELYNRPQSGKLSYAEEAESILVGWSYVLLAVTIIAAGLSLRWLGFPDERKRIAKCQRAYRRPALIAYPWVSRGIAAVLIWLVTTGVLWAACETIGDFLIAAALAAICCFVFISLAGRVLVGLLSVAQQRTWSATNKLSTAELVAFASLMVSLAICGSAIISMSSYFQHGGEIWPYGPLLLGLLDVTRGDRSPIFWLLVSAGVGLAVDRALAQRLKRFSLLKRLLERSELKEHAANDVSATLAGKPNPSNEISLADLSSDIARRINETTPHISRLSSWLTGGNWTNRILSYPVWLLLLAPGYVFFVITTSMAGPLLLNSGTGGKPVLVVTALGAMSMTLFAAEASFLSSYFFRTGVTPARRPLTPMERLAELHTTGATAIVPIFVLCSPMWIYLVWIDGASIGTLGAILLAWPVAWIISTRTLAAAIETLTINWQNSFMPDFAKAFAGLLGLLPIFAAAALLAAELWLAKVALDGNGLATWAVGLLPLAISAAMFGWANAWHRSHG